MNSQISTVDLPNNGNDENHPPAPPIAPITNAQHPSEGWLRNLAWIDGGVNPPHYYYTHEEINEALTAAGVMPRCTEYEQQVARVTPTPTAPAPPMPLTPSLMNISGNHYRMGVTVSELFSPAPTPTTGHLVNMTLNYSAPAVAPPGHGKVISKKAKITKMDTISLESITRVEFIKAILAIHNLSDKFAPGVHSGPNMKVWWTGASGGKGGAPSIQTDHQFGIALEALLKKDKTKVQVSVELDLDDMEGFRIQQISLPGISDATAVPTDEELAYGTRVPQVDNFSDLAQLHGRFILELKKKWPCQMHQGEHGETGYCYITPTSEHICLNPLRFKAWAAAMAAGDATKHELPNVTAFDGARDGHCTGPRARGRTGPFTSATQPAELPTLSSDVMGMLMAALLRGLSCKRSHSESESPTKLALSTPKRLKSTSATTVAVSDLPMPEKGLELRACLHDFAELEGIDLTIHEVPLHLEDYSPDIIPFVDDAELHRITGATSGIVIKFKRFCKDWFNRYKQKLHANN
ncbi:hypothetical protein CPB84DRAFT_1688378 [Gymnopilus junonius]|uniref:Uncharacterized protein n=1 Tax=Gymnopilus junonius TaxID=109634 RepID=A0A9P5TGH9_GYMJU|nr:hypothetical protein CPB84DRAFT_1688378 [Gymnopilus junonius]